MQNVEEIVARLYEAKTEEQALKAVRISLEEELARAIQLPPEWEGSKTKTVGDFKVRLTRNMNVKIDEDRLREIAAKKNLQAEMQECFRWKPELRKTEWRQAAASIKTAFASALSFTPGKPSFSVFREA